MTTNQKAKLLSITLVRLEGNETPSIATDNWKVANKILEEWATTSPKADIGSHLCNALLVFDNGKTFSMDFYLNRLDSKDFSLSSVFVNWLKFSPELFPKHLPMMQYKSYFQTWPMVRESYAKMLDTLEILR